MPDAPDRATEFDRGNAAFATGDYETAITAFRQAVEIDPEFFDGWHALGMTLLKSGQVREAIGCGLKATTLKPNDLLAWTALSQMYVQDGQIAEAEEAKGRARILSLGGKVVKEEPGPDEA